MNQVGTAVLLFALALPLAAAPEEPVSMEARITRLEQRVAELEKGIAPVAEKQRAEEHRAALAKKARERWAEDNKLFTPEQLKEIEQLYQVANRQWRSPEAKESLEKLVSSYSNANRTGCAVLYLGRMSEGADREKYLRRAIEKHPDCWYGDGTNVGAYARFCLAWDLHKAGKADEAEKLFAELREKYSDAIDHSGRRLLDNLPKADEATTAGAVKTADR
jgi:tetratricopeptide (TPR) repeat protein